MLKDRTWLTENTEIYSVNGWLPISCVHKAREIIVLNSISNKLEAGRVKEFNIRDFSGTVPTSRFGNQNSQGFIYYYKDSIWTPMDLKALPTTKLVPYTGKLYNIVTNTNNLFVRTVFNDIDNQDYILCQSVK